MLLMSWKRTLTQFWSQGQILSAKLNEVQSESEYIIEIKVKDFVEENKNFRLNMKLNV